MESKVTQEIVPMSVSQEEALNDYRIACESRQASLLGRREVLTGKAKFGIFGDGKELPQIAMAKAFRPGDIRSGYYRDQTFMLAAGMTTLEELFAQLYATPDVELEPASAGRQMNAHFATRTLDDDGEFKNLAQLRVSAADSSPTGSQMPRLVGLAYASKLYRHLPELADCDQFSDRGNEIAFGTIGNASCAEGMFWEAINAIGVLEAPVMMSIWDDGYGISVPNEYQITKGDLSEILSGFQRQDDDDSGFDLYTVKGWDYPGLCHTYMLACEEIRRSHVPAIVHVNEVTQPQGHSTSGSHERYKSPERLKFEEDFDCLSKMRQWLIEQEHATDDELEAIEYAAKQRVRQAQKTAWEQFIEPIRSELSHLATLIERLAERAPQAEALSKLSQQLRRQPSPVRRHLMVAARQALLLTRQAPQDQRAELMAWVKDEKARNYQRYSTFLHSAGPDAALGIEAIAPHYEDDAPTLNGFEILNRCFDDALGRMPQVIAFGEDVGKLGDVNQGFIGLQEKYGELRVSDTGIRECTILGQAIGMAMRGLRPIAEIQYLDYLLYALQIISDDLATLRYRTYGGQKAPVIVRTRGHRLEGVWHSGSPMAGILNNVRGVYLCVPRNMTQAAGFYNTLLRSDDSAIVVEVLNGYRLKEKLPSNIGEMTVPLGVPEILRPGADVTLVTYGACCRIALEAAESLSQVGIDVEIVDVQTLLPFDRPGILGESLKKTNRILFLDEDVPGGATAYMMQEVLEKQQGFHWLDSPPKTLSAQPHRPPFGSDGDYYSKPSVEDVFDAVYEMMYEADPQRFPIFYRA